MSTENIINSILAKREDLNYAETKENREVWDKILKLEERMKELAPRLAEMFKVAEALTENRFWMGGRSGYRQAAPEFLTDHIDHRVGFYVEHPYFDAPGRDYTLTGFFGVANGGACGDYDMKIDKDGNVQRCPFSQYGSSDRRYKRMRDDYLDDLSKVVEKFDAFERAFYEYAKNPIPRSTRL